MPARYRRSARPVRRGGGRPRQLVWAEVANSVTVGAGAGNNIDLLATSLENAGQSHLGITIMRTIVTLQVQNWAGVTDAIFMGLVIGRPADVGTTPLLGSMPGLDWYWREQLLPVANGAAVNVSQRYDYDVRSKRKMAEVDQRDLLCFDNISAASKNIQFFVRTLVALP